MSPEQAVRFGTYLRERREAQQLSKMEVARLIGVQDTTIMRLEQGKFLAPAPDKLRRLAQVLDIPPNDLFVMADYMVADELPSPSLYLRAKYPDLPPEAIEEMEQYLQGLMREHGATTGPKAGEDEN
jgi:transcriptional regulator with XRE-family HTH domain